MNPETETDTVEDPLSSSMMKFPQLTSSLVKVDVSALSDAGKVRPNNEDHYLIARFGRTLQTLLTNLPEGSISHHFDEIGYGMIVADGMGGMTAGEVASRTAINTFLSLVLNTSDWILRIGEQEAEEVMRRMAERFRRVNTSLLEQAALDLSLSGMGTTMTMAASIGADMVITHVGDSRVYLLHEDILHKLTLDHTVAQALIDTGVISTNDDVAVRRFRSILTQAVGVKVAKFEPQVQRIHLADGDQVLICTDGLTDMVNDAAIAATLQEKESATKACLALVDLALQRGGMDNVTVVVARYSIPHGIVESL
jgi:protein phosphatase